MIIPFFTLFSRLTFQHCIRILNITAQGSVVSVERTESENVGHNLGRGDGQGSPDVNDFER